MDTNIIRPIFISHRVEDISYIHSIRKSFLHNAERLSLDKNFISDCLIIINELCSNLIKYAEGNKEIIFRILPQKNGACIDFLSIDNGPRFHFENALQDGYSTSTSLGTGLGSIKRLSSTTKYAFSDGWGKVIYTRKCGADSKPLDTNLDALCVPMNGEKVSGDASGDIQSSKLGCRRLILVDGLGHGTEANVAAETAIDVFSEYKDDFLDILIEKIHAALKNTRGAALFLGDVYHDRLEYMSIGNIQGRIFSDSIQSKGLLERPGIVGYRMNHKKVYSEKLLKGDTLVCHSDGFSTVTKMPKINGYAPLLVCAMVYSKLASRNDDRSILIYKHL